MTDLKHKARNLLFRILNTIENNNIDNIYKNGEYSLLKKIMKQFDGDNFILFDVGANKGSYSTIAVKAFHEVNKQKNILVYAFEPVPATFLQLKENLKSLPKSKPVNSGISETEETREIFYDDTQSGCASLYNRAEIDAPSRMNITLTRLDYFMSKANITKIDLLKIDTEGHELSALKSAGDYLHPGAIRAIQFEYGGTYLDSRIYLRDIYDLLIPRGYKIYKIYKNSIAQRTYHPAMENFQYANYVALH